MRIELVSKEVTKYVINNPSAKMMYSFVREKCYRICCAVLLSYVRWSAKTFRKLQLQKNVQNVSSFAIWPREEEIQEEKEEDTGRKEIRIEMCLRIYFIRRASNFYFRCSLTRAARSFIN